MTKRTILTGIKPTGKPHLGNYLGMIKPTLELCRQNEGHDNYLFLANYHSLNSVQNAAEHQTLTYDLAATLLGCGLDPDKTVMFRESDVPEIAELSNFLMYVTPKGLMNKVHSYKAATRGTVYKNAEMLAEFQKQYPTPEYSHFTVLSPVGYIKRVYAVDPNNREIASVKLYDVDENEEFADPNEVQGAEAGPRLEHVDSSIKMGLYTYPVLMAADILLFDTTHVPVGKDQVQHVEIARDIAGYFNNTFGNTLMLPEHVVQADVATVPGLDGRKMSKSYDNVVPIFAPEKEIIAAVKRIVTDSLRPEEPKDPETNNVYLIYKAIADKNAAADMADKFRSGKMGYGEAKQLLADRIITEFKDRYARFEEHSKDRKAIDAVFAKGAAKARAKAQEVIAKVRKAVGVA